MSRLEKMPCYRGPRMIKTDRRVKLQTFLSEEERWGRGEVDIGF